MSELINYSMGIRSNRVDPALTEGQAKKSYPEARARRSSFSSSSKENNVAVEQQQVQGRKSLANDFEKNHSQAQKEQTVTSRKTNPDALKQCDKERAVLGKKQSTNSNNLAGRGLTNGAPFYRQEATSNASSVVSSSADSAPISKKSSFVEAADQSQRFGNTSAMNVDHFSKSSNVALPQQGASPKKQGLKFMQGPPEFVAETPARKIRHTHTVRDARGAASVMNVIVQQSANNSVASSRAGGAEQQSVYRRGASSATYNIITGQ